MDVIEVTTVTCLLYNSIILSNKINVKIITKNEYKKFILIFVILNNDYYWGFGVPCTLGPLPLNTLIVKLKLCKKRKFVSSQAVSLLLIFQFEHCCRIINEDISCEYEFEFKKCLVQLYANYSIFLNCVVILLMYLIYSTKRFFNFLSSIA